ncbi:tripartite tricarboxylate transporter TctB family protein [Brevibacillus agri]|uniref:tripartite tricarboxylate transporter TctB family protein n=1 Tax=Brevibacillus agri TaxID=51101 RepID=UPI002E1FBFAD|nr:tripartite tricarboxylate transporter TctB family protein [Brevibacillus agri]
MRNAGVWAAVVLLLFSGLVLWQSLELDYKSTLGIGPGFFPVWLSLILLLLSILYIGVAKKESISIFEIVPKKSEFMDFLLIIGSMVLFVAVVKTVGFVAAAAASLFLLFFRAFNKFVSVILSVSISALLFFIFEKGLAVPLPVNSFGW